MADELEKVSIAWHPAFYSTAEYDLRDEKENLCFETEHNLSREPLRIDLLIIKKKSETASNNDIARIFRKYNIIEYKSPEDGLTIDDFYKTIGYACLYKGLAKSVNEIPASEMTVSLFRESYPRKMIDMLTSEGSVTENTAPGIYEVKNAGLFPTQIVVTKELDPSKHAGLRILSKNAREDDIRLFLEQARSETSPGELININAILQVSVSANQKTYEDIKRRDSDMYDALKALMKDEIEEGIRKGKAEGKAEGRAEGRAEGKAESRREIALNMLKANLNIDDIVKLTGLSLLEVYELRDGQIA